MINISVALFLILGEAIYEGLADKGKGATAGVIEFFHRAFMSLIVFAYIGGYYIFDVKIERPFHEIVIAFVFVRYALFDVTYNLITGNELFYIGFTKWYDKAWRWFFGWTHFPEHFLLITKFVFLFWGLAWLA